MLASWMYDSAIGDWVKTNGFRPGNMLAIILFTIFAISVFEYVLIGRDKEEDSEN
jgi:ABC-type sugar transport system permease subunit